MQRRRSTVGGFALLLLTLACPVFAQAPAGTPPGSQELQQIRAKALAAPVFLQDAKPSTATRASSPGRWGLQAADFSLTFDEAIVAKAGLPGRWKELEAAAKAGDAYAQTLAGIYLSLPAGGSRKSEALRFFRMAAKQGLERAGAAVVADEMSKGDDGRSDREIEAMLDRAYVFSRSDSAHARWMFWRMIKDDVFYQAVIAMEYSAKAGYAPALLDGARFFLAQGKNSKEAWQKAGKLAEAAAAAGLPEAAEFLKQRPAP